ncbi:MAG: OmpA family protein [Pseudomonadota bacterium]
MSGSTKFVIGLAALVLLVLLTNAVKHQAIEAALTKAARDELAQAGLTWVDVRVEGRNALLTGTATDEASKQAAISVVDGINGMHSTKGVFSVLDAVSPYLWLADFTGDSLLLSGVVPSADMMSSVVSKASEIFQNVRIRNELRVATGVPDGDWFGAVGVGLESLSQLQSGRAQLRDVQLMVNGFLKDAALSSEFDDMVAAVPPGYEGLAAITIALPDTTARPPLIEDDPTEPGPLVMVPPEAQAQIDRCQSRIDDVMRGKTINFLTGSAEVTPQPNPLILELAAVARACSPARITISGHTDSVGDPEANQILSKARAQAVVNLLVDEGLSPKQLEAQGFGSSEPVAENTTPEGRSANRRIEFRVVYDAAMIGGG